LYLAIVRCTLGTCLKTFKWILGLALAFLAFCVTTVFASLISANVEKLAEDQGWNRLAIQSWAPVILWLAVLTGARWFWFLFGLSLGIALGMWASKFFGKAEARETSLQIDYEGSAANKIETNTDVFIRARARNTGPGTAKNARVLLTSLKEVHPSGATTPTSFHDSKLLPWAGFDFKPRDLPSSPYAHFYVDLMRVSKHEPGWIFCVQQVFASQSNLKDYKGTYRFNLTLTADNAKPVTFEVDVTYFGDWHNLRAVAVPRS
jgi:hypothetical protein